MKKVRLRDGRVIECDDVKADRLVRKGWATYVVATSVAASRREVAARRGR